MTDIDKLSDNQADAMVAAMLAGWKHAIEEADRLRAEVRRLRAIEAATRDYAEVYHFGGLAESTTRYGRLLAALAAKEAP